MKKKVNPIAAIAAAIFLVALIAFLFMKNVAPHEPAYTVSPPEFDADGGPAKRANYAKAHGGQMPPGAARQSDDRQ